MIPNVLNTGTFFNSLSSSDHEDESLVTSLVLPLLHGVVFKVGVRTHRTRIATACRSGHNNSAPKYKTTKAVLV